MQPEPMPHSTTTIQKEERGAQLATKAQSKYFEKQAAIFQQHTVSAVKKVQHNQESGRLRHLVKAITAAGVWQL